MFSIVPFTAILGPPMCNLYSQTKSQDAMRHAFDGMVAPATDALWLQRPLADGMLQSVAEGVPEDAG